MLKRLFERKLSGRPNLKKILGNTWWLFFDKIVRMGLALVVGLWVARYLGPEKFGALNNSIAVATLFGAFATLGLESFVIQETIKDPSQKSAILGTAFYLKLFAGFITYFLAVVSIMLLKSSDGDQLDRYLVYLISFGILFQSLDVIDYYFQSQTNSKYTVLAKVSMFLIVSAGKILLIVLNAHLIYFGLAALLELIFNGLALIYIYVKKGNNIVLWSFDKAIARRLLVQSWPVYIAYVAAIIYMKIDQIMIGSMLGDKPAGLFAASTKLYELPLFVVLIFSSSVFPSLVEMYEKNRDRFYKKYGQITGLYTLLGYFLLVGVAVLGPFAIDLLYGVEYAEAFPILSVQIIGMFFMFNAGLRSSYLTITSNQKIIMTTTTISAFLNIALNFVFIPVYGAVGAAFSTALTQFCSLFFLNYFFSGTKQIFKIQFHSIYLRTLLK